MSQRSHELATQLFRSQFQSAYEESSQLEGRVMTLTGQHDAAVHFPVIGTAKSRQRGSQQEVVVSNIGNKRPMAVLTPMEAFDLVDKQDRYITNVDLLAAYGKPLGATLGRQKDVRVIDVLRSYDPNAYSRPGMTSSNYGDTHEIETENVGAISAKDIAKAVARLKNESVWMAGGKCTAVVPALQFEQMSQDEKWANRDFWEGTRVTQDAILNRAYGCDVVFYAQGAIDNEQDEGALKTATINSVANQPTEWFVFVQNAVGLAISAVETLGVVEWIPMRRSHLVGGESSAGATRIQNSGIIVGSIKTS